MSFPPHTSKKRSLNARVTSNRRLRHIANRMVARNTREAIGTLGEKGPADVGPGRMFVGDGDAPSDQMSATGMTFDDFDNPSVNRKPWQPGWEPRRAENLIANPSGEPELVYGDSLDPIEGRHYLVKLGDAAEVLKQLTREQLLTLEARLARIGNYRAWTVRQQARKIYGRNLSRAMAELFMSCYRQTRKRRGNERVSTRSLKWRVKGPKRGLFCGLEAWKNPEGRPALSTAEWTRRYEERLRKRRKNPDKPRGPHKVTVPQTLNTRPDSWPAHRPDPPHDVATVTRPETTGPFGTTDVDELLKEGVGEMLKEMGKELAQEFGKWFRETLDSWRDRLFGQ